MSLTVSKKDLLRNGYVIFAISLIIAAINQMDKDLALLFGVLIVCVLLFIISFKSKFKVILRLLSIFSFLHFLVFPIIYILLLRANYKSFEFDGTILNIEKTTSLSEIQSNYSPKETQIKMDLLDKILSRQSSIIDTTMSYLKDGNLIVLDSFIINVAHERYPKPPGDMPYAASPYLYVTDNRGELIVAFYEIDGIDFEKSEKRVRYLLQQLHNHYRNRLSGYNNAKVKIEKENNIWTYRAILAYSVNIFFSDNMVPKSRTSNAIVFIHNLIVIVFLLGTIVGISQNFIDSKNSLK